MTVSFKSATTLDANTIMVVDAMNLAFRYKHKDQVNFMDDFIRTVDSLRKSYKAGKVVIACDAGSSKFRKAIYPEYKSARKEKFESQTPEEAESFKLFFGELTRTMNMYEEVNDYPLLRFPGCEADDTAAYIVQKYGNTKNIWLMSSDKDWDLLVGLNTSRFSYVTRKETTLDTWDQHYEYDPEHHIFVKCITGDTGDSIPGVDGIGPKKAAALAKEYDTLDNLIAALPISSKYVHIKRLNEFGAENIERNRKLMDLVSFSEEALGPDVVATIDAKLKEYIGE